MSNFNDGLRFHIKSLADALAHKPSENLVAEDVTGLLNKAMEDTFEMFSISKAEAGLRPATEDADGNLTAEGMRIAHLYAVYWTEGRRAIGLEAHYPELEGLFYDIRIDPELTARHAIPEEVAKSELDVELDKAFAAKKPVTLLFTPQ